MFLNVLLFFEISIVLCMILALYKFKRKQFSSDLLFVFLEEKNRMQLETKNIESTKYHKVKKLLLLQALNILILFVTLNYMVISNDGRSEMNLIVVFFLLLNRYVVNFFVEKSLN